MEKENPSTQPHLKREDMGQRRAGAGLTGLQAEQELELRTQELESMFRIASILVQPGSIDEKSRGVLEEVARTCQANRVTLRVPDEPEGGLRWISEFGESMGEGPPPLVIPYGSGLVGLAFESGEPAIANNYTDHSAAIEPFSEYGTTSIAVVPISSSGRSLGTVTIVSREKDHFTPERIKLLTHIGDWLGVLLEDARLSEDGRERVQEAEVISEISRIITSTLDIGEVYERFGEELRKLVPFDRMVIITADEDVGVITVRYIYGQQLYGRSAPFTHPLQDSQIQLMISKGGPLILDEPRPDSQYQVEREAFRLGIRSGIMAPLVSKSRIIGAITLRSLQPGLYGLREQTIIEQLANHIAPAIENAVLFQEARQLAVALESIGDAVSFTGSDGIIRFVNKSWEGMYGFSREEALGKHFTIFVPDTIEYRRTAAGIQLEALETAWRGELLRVRKSGEHMDTKKTLTPVKDKDGSTLGIIAVTQDITESKRVEERMQEANRLASIGELAAGVAHEINNPLGIIVGSSELLEIEDLSPTVLTRVKTIQRQADRAARIVRNLLSFARRQEPEQRYLGVDSILEQAIALKSTDLDVNDIKVIKLWPADLPKIWVDEHQLVQVIVNILANAEQAMVGAHGGGNLTIEVGLLGDHLRISISDDGPGILPEHLPKIFDPFFTTKPVGEGTGLGLSTCYGIVHQLGGEIWAESEPDQGATFHIELPLLDPKIETPAPPDQHQALPAEIPRNRILVVDDEPEIRNIYQTALSRDGYMVDTAVDGQEGWDKIQSTRYGCVVLDLKMPGMSGQQVHALIAESDEELGNKTIFMTGDIVSQNIKDFIANSGNPVLTKPFRMEELVNLINSMMAGSKASN